MNDAPEAQKETGNEAMVQKWAVMLHKLWISKRGLRTAAK
jgi:hypothetical protein